MSEVKYKIAVVAHVFYSDLAREMIKYLKNIPFEFDIFVSAPVDSVSKVNRLFVRAFGEDRVSVKGVENVGFDVAPFLCEFNECYDQYDYICKVHTKKSTRHYQGFGDWRKYLFDHLLGSAEIVKSILAEFETNENLGMIFPETYCGVFYQLELDSWGLNWDICKNLAERMGIMLEKNSVIDFPAGSMFWVRPKALKSLLSLNLTVEDFRSDIRKDGTAAHAVERLFALSVKSSGYEWKSVFYEFPVEGRDNVPYLKRYFSRMIHFKNQHIQRLYSNNRRLLKKSGSYERIKTLETKLKNLQRSYSYRIGRLFVYPVYLVGQFFKKMVLGFVASFNIFVHPISFIKKFSFKNVRRFFRALGNEKFSDVMTNVRRYFLPVDEKSLMCNKKNVRYELYQDIDRTKKMTFKKEENPLVSIIIPVYNQWDFTYSCLYSVLKNSEGVSYEVIVADDCSTDTTVKIKNYVENIKVVRTEKNLGFLRNCKNAASYASGKYILFLNNDTNVQPKWLDSLVELIESDEKIGLVGSKFVYPDGRLQEAGGIIWDDATGWNYGKFNNPQFSEFNYVKEVDYISGASIMVSKELWEEIGGFDERYDFAYYEDTDFAFEVRKHGYKVMYQPKSVVVHFEGISHGKDETSELKGYQIKNREIFREKWKDVLSKENFSGGKYAFWARDRSSRKKTILVIDHYVPNFDQDAGGRSVFQYLKLFCDMGLNVKFLGDKFQRTEPYTSILQQMGIEVLYGQKYALGWKKWIRDNSKFLDYIYLNRPFTAEKYIAFVKENTDAKIIYYGHDLHYLRGHRQIKYDRRKALVGHVEKCREVEAQIFSDSDVVYYPSEFEIAEIKKNFPNVNAKVIPVYVYDDFSNEISSFDKRRGIIFVGSFAHAPNPDGIKWFVNEIWPKVRREIGDLEFYVVGKNPPTELCGVDGIVLKGYLSDKELADLYKKCKISVIPLRYGAGVKGKVVEAMYEGVPVITTSIGAEGIPDVEKVIEVVDGADDFAESLIELYRDNGKLNEMAKSAIEYVKNVFSVENVRRILEEDIVVNNEVSHKDIVESTRS